jgi:hypothetical protein
MATNLVPKSSNLFVCEICDFKTSRNSHYIRHKNTSKHEKLQKITSLVPKVPCYHCECGKEYSHHSSLWKHKKKCSNNKNEKEDESPKEQTDLVTFLLKENNELKNMILEVCKNMKTITNQNTFTNTNSNNNNNTTFNLQFFLNETCKDAINLSEFVDSIKIELSDLENVGSKGYIEGISDIILKNLKPLDVTMRPVHCSDVKREVVYVKEENVWSNDSKEMPENQKLKKAIKQVSNKNIGVIKEWKEKYPDCVLSESRKSDMYNQIIGESMDYTSENSEKIIKKIVKEVIIDKNTFISL